jgi:ribose/xylose/arabinose/galactoside ABC-type transport system permease subunit
MANETKLGILKISVSEDILIAWRHLRNNALVVIFLSIFLFLSFSSEQFATTNNILLILIQLTPLGIVVVGQTLVLITGGIDLSVGSVAAFTSIIAAKLMQDDAAFHFPPLIAIVVALIGATMIGWVHGWLISRRKLAPFIVTFGSLSLIKGMALVYSNATPIAIPNSLSRAIWRVGTYSRPLPLLALVIVAMGMTYILRSTKLGRYAYAIGSNETVTRMSGVRVDYYKIQVYMLSSFLAGLAGVLLMTRIRSGVYTTAEDYALLSVAAVVIGGTSLQGGVGNVQGPLLGALIIVMLDTSLSFFNISSLWSMVITGCIILLAALLDGERQRSSEKIPKARVETPAQDVYYYQQIRSQLSNLIMQRFACENIRLYMVDRQTSDLVEQHLDGSALLIIDQPHHLAKRVEASLLPIWGDDLRAETEFVVEPIQPNLRSFVAVPIIRRDRFIGVLELQSPYENVFGENTAVQLSILVQQVALSLENAWLLDSGWLLRHTREAYRHVWDEVYLSKCDLATWLYTSSQVTQAHLAARGSEVQKLLLKFIDILGEKDEKDPSRLKRRYKILHETYVQGRTTEAIMSDLGVSRRQYFYDLKDALEALVHLLVDHELYQVEN